MAPRVLPPGSEQMLQSLFSELAALRERVQMQHALLDVYAQRRGTPVNRPIEIWDRLATRVGHTAGGGVETSAPEPAPAPAAARTGVDIPAGTPWWPLEEPEARPLLPNVGWSLYATAANVTDVIGFSVCGLEPAALAETIELIASVQREKRNFVPLILTDSADFAVFRRHGFTAEYLPSAPPAGVPLARWREYVAARRAFLMRKWRLPRIVEFGPVAFGGGEVRHAEAGAGDELSGLHAMAAVPPQPAGEAASAATPPAAPAAKATAGRSRRGTGAGSKRSGSPSRPAGRRRKS
jgi:hypothetical protein